MKINREEVYNKCGGRCAYCGNQIKIKEMQVDHIIPTSFFSQHINNKVRVPKFLNHLTESDVNHMDNLLPTCRVCNKWKSAHDLELFRKEIEEQVRRLNDYSSNYRMAKRYGLVEETIKPIIFYFEVI
jgi:5-methylcytosine-specific restriction endonuclease McrA